MPASLEAVPSPEETQILLAEAENQNPGSWIDHVRHVGRAARYLAERHPRLDPERAWALGCLHDIGRRQGYFKLRHITDGWRYLTEQGFPGAARICLTHSFPLPQLDAYFGPRDAPLEDEQFLEDFLSTVEFDDYDRLIQLADTLCLPSGFCLLEKRMLDVASRYGVCSTTVPVWKALFAIRREMEAEMECSIYDCLPGVRENTFAQEIAIALPE